MYENERCGKSDCFGLGSYWRIVEGEESVEKIIFVRDTTIVGEFRGSLLLLPPHYPRGTRAAR